VTNSLQEPGVLPTRLTLPQTISINATQITERLDSGRVIGERLTKVGLIIAATTSFLAPLNLLTSYYGMNMTEMTNDGLVTLFRFWNVGLPVALCTLVFMFFVFIWVWNRNIRI
jgi:Mg2+ and Co2+ transporter CorA